MSTNQEATRISRRGMTLVECTVTVAILILLAAFILPRWFCVARDSDVTIFNSNIAIINVASSTYLSDKHHPAAGLAILVDEGYLDELPASTSGREYAFNGYYVDNVCDHDH